jgi:LysR family cyn operon transcriptional activator
MELRHLRYFVSLAEELSFTRAAKRMHVTQSTLSHQIKQLEQEIGYDLFDRVGKRVMISEAGAALLLNATRALREVDEGLRALKKKPETLKGELRVGATHTFNMSVIPDCLCEFIGKHPLMRVGVEELFASEIENRLMSESIEIGISYDPRNNEQLVFEPLYIEEMVLAVSSSHPFANRKRIRLAELHMQQLVLATHASLTRRIIEQSLASVGAEPIIVLEIDSVAGMLAIIRRTNLGAIVSRLAFAETNDLKLVALESPTPLRAPGLLTKIGRPQSLAARTFSGIVRRTILSRRKIELQ